MDTVNRSNFPYLAGQYAGVIYKELHDFQSGARVNVVMSPFAVGLSDEDMTDISTLNRDERTGPDPDTFNYIPS